MKQTHRIAIVGIEGAGKSTVIRRLLEARAHEEIGVIHCPTYHANPDAPLGSLSRAVEAYSNAADELGSFELKAAALYLQMTLYGPVERALEHAFSPRFVISECHPIVDTLAFGPFYQRMVQKRVDPRTWAGPLEEALERRVPGAYQTLLAWHDSESRRLGRTTSFWELPHEVCDQLGRRFDEIVCEFSLRYRTGLPNEIVLLDIAEEEAHARVRTRSADGTELHETAGHLGALRNSYSASLDALSRSHPEIRIHRIEAGEGRSTNACVDEILAVTALARRDSSGALIGCGPDSQRWKVRYVQGR